MKKRRCCNRDFVGVEDDCGLVDLEEEDDCFEDLEMADLRGWEARLGSVVDEEDVGTFVDDEERAWRAVFLEPAEGLPFGWLWSIP